MINVLDLDFCKTFRRSSFQTFVVVGKGVPKVMIGQDLQKFFGVNDLKK